MNIVFIGPPGSGKSTHARNISHLFNLRLIDIGELIRTQAKAKTHKAKLINQVANVKGTLLPDGIVLDLLLDHLPVDQFNNICLDGFPRNINQYDSLIDILNTSHQHIDLVVYLDIPDQLSVDRVISRNRPDDEPQAIAQRLEEYHRLTKPLLEEIGQDHHLFRIDATKPEETVANAIIAKLNLLNLNPINPPPTPKHPNRQPSPSKKSHHQHNYRSLFVLTHSESDYNKKHLFTGRIDIALTPEGIRKAKLAAKILKHQTIDIAYRTSLVRTKQTLDEILIYHPKTKVIIDDRLIERDYGDLANLSKDEYEKKHPDLFPIYHRSYDVPPPGGESMIQVEQRVLPALHEIINTIKSQKANVLIVAHGNSIRPIRRYFEKLTANEMMNLEHLRHQIFTYKIPISD